MKILLVVFLFQLSILAKESKRIPHLDLEMSGTELHSLLRIRDDGEEDSELDPVMKIGKRYLTWLKIVNQNRPEELKLSLSNAEIQPGYPIDSPKISSPKIILELFSQLKKDLPEEFKKVLTTQAALTDSIPVSDADFVIYGRKIDDLYASASRWLLQKPYLWVYASKKHDDIRGYYFLKQTPQVENQLTNWEQLAADTQIQFRGWLEGLCFNSEATASVCGANLDKTIAENGNPLPYFKRYLQDGESKWNKLFLIQNKRDDLLWSIEHPELLSAPFSKPDTYEVEQFLRLNIEDEWRWLGWQLRLNFTQGGMDTTHVIFSPGATPHVNGLGGNEITMDANQPITEYHVRWTIRHEYGHTLGFPDCYIEFYDTDKAVMISYQIDTTNLMCSRRGKLQEKHFEELKRVYFTP
ncbi:MAG: hypothetical protein FJ112_09075 [Deltaproteobacteria bacterium]|nr:hypothetical protein [Deltaproteobacteria bacterium]